MPESTTAIVGADNGAACVVQSTAAPTVHAHFCVLDWGRSIELICTWSFGTIAETNDVLVRKPICVPLSIACTPLIARNVRRIWRPPIAFVPRLALSRLFRSPLPPVGLVPSTMTSNFLFGVCWIALASESGT
jgi:hypothetical protein